jgi:hypothetical protein
MILIRSKILVAVFVISFLLGSYLNLEAAVTSSSNEEGFSAESAFDGNQQTRWASEFSDSQWLQIDLAVEQEIVGLMLYWEAAYARSYEVFLSTDAKNWQSVYKQENSDGGIDDIYFGKKKTRFIKIQGIKRATAWGYSLWEVEILGLDKEIKLEATSHLANYKPEKALDADYNTKWYTKNKEAVLEIGFLNPVSLGGMEIVWDADFPVSYTIETSGDGKSWQQVAENDNCRGGKELMSFNMINKRFINISCKKNEARGGFGVIELKPKKWQELAESSKLNMIRGLSGDVGVPHKVYAGRDGSFQALPHNFKVQYFIYDHDTDTLFTPQTLPVSWNLLEGGYPVNVVDWQADELAVKSTLFSKWFNDTECLLSFYNIKINNNSSKKRRLSLFLIIQKSELAKEELKEIRLNEKNFIMVDGVAGIYLKEKFQAVGDSKAIDLLKGICEKRTSIFENSFDLDANDTKQFNFITPSVRKDKNISLEKIKSVNFDEELKNLTVYWNNMIPMKLSLPDKRFQDCFYSCLYYILLCMDGYDLHPGPYHYREFTLHDSVGLAAALERVGLSETVSKALPYFKFNKGKDEGYLDGLGGNIYTLYEHYLFTRDKEFLKAAYPQIKDLAYYIHQIREPQLIEALNNTALYGLLPAACSQDNFKYPSHLYVDNWWSLVGLKCAYEAAIVLGEKEDAEFFNEEYKNFRSCILKSIDKAMSQNNFDYMPGFADPWPKEMRVVDLDHRILGETQMAWAHRPAMFPGDALGLEIPKEQFKQSYKHYWKKAGSFSGYDGGWFVEYEKLFWGYNAKISHPCIYLNMEDVSYKSLLWMVEHQSCPGGWMEAMPSRKNEEGFYEIAEGIVGDIPHTWSAAHYVLHLRDILLREKDDKLIFFSAIPQEWLDDGEVIELKNAATYFGPIDIKLESHTQDKYLLLTVSCKTPPAGGYEVLLPIDNIDKVDANAEVKITNSSFVLSNEATEAKIYLK